MIFIKNKPQKPSTNSFSSNQCSRLRKYVTIKRAFQHFFAIAIIFACEVLEGANIIGNYRTAIIKSYKWKNEEHRQIALSAVTKWALIAAAGAVAVVVAVAIPLGLLSQELDERVVEIIEGVSKVVAAVCILQLTLKIPVWLDLY